MSLGRVANMASITKYMALLWSISRNHWNDLLCSGCRGFRRIVTIVVFVRLKSVLTYLLNGFARSTFSTRYWMLFILHYVIYSFISLDIMRRLTVRKLLIELQMCRGQLAASLLTASHRLCWNATGHWNTRRRRVRRKFVISFVILCMKWLARAGGIVISSLW